MRGTGRNLLAALLVGACAAASAAQAGGAEPGPPPGASTSSLQVARPAKGASAATETTIFMVSGTAASNNLTAFNDGTARLVITSPEGIVEPDGSAPDCVQDSPTQVSCRPGFIGAISGDLGDGTDTFTANASLSTLIGISLVVEQRPLSGGPGRDRIVGGAGGDLISGGGGPDALLGFGGSDLLRGESGKDNLSGGGSPDVLMGGSGPDHLDGGAAKDLCNGGGAIDTAKSCNATKKVP